MGREPPGHGREPPEHFDPRKPHHDDEDNSHLILHALDRIEKFNQRLDGRITYIERRLREMAVDQNQFQAAFAEFTADMDAGMAAVIARVNELETATGVDLSAELATLTEARAKFDAAVTDATDGQPVEPTP